LPRRADPGLGGARTGGATPATIPRARGGRFLSSSGPAQEPFSSGACRRIRRWPAKANSSEGTARIGPGGGAAGPRFAGTWFPTLAEAPPRRWSTTLIIERWAGRKRATDGWGPGPATGRPPEAGRFVPARPAVGGRATVPAAMPVPGIDGVIGRDLDLVLWGAGSERFYIVNARTALIVLTWRGDELADLPTKAVRRLVTDSASVGSLRSVNQAHH